MKRRYAGISAIYELYKWYARSTTKVYDLGQKLEAVLDIRLTVTRKSRLASSKEREYSTTMKRLNSMTGGLDELGRTINNKWSYNETQRLAGHE